MESDYFPVGLCDMAATIDVHEFRAAPFDIGDGWHVIEQQAYANAGDTIESLDLLCSGFHAEQGAHD